MFSSAGESCTIPRHFCVQPFVGLVPELQLLGTTTHNWQGSVKWRKLTKLALPQLFKSQLPLGE